MEKYGKSASRALRRGFTILELMIVISIIAILATLVTKAAMSSIKEARYKDAKIMAQSIKMGIVNYHAQNGKWPGKIEDCADKGDPPTGNTHHPGFLSNDDADKVVQLVIKEGETGNPLIDASGLFVATRSAANARHGHGMNFGEARRRGVPLTDMAFGYQKFGSTRCNEHGIKKSGEFCRFLIKYDVTNDTVSVKCCED